MPSEITLNGIVVIVGNYGSGKTEVAINLAVDQRTKGRHVRMADLDLVNPYFRTREARRALDALGIDMILPLKGWLQADLPILAPQVAGLIREPGGLAILDAGGDDVGATVLAALADAFQSTTALVSMFQVVNPFRPNTDTVGRCLQMRAAIEAVSRRQVTGWIGNPHLMELSTADHVRQGYALMQALVQDSGLPLVCMSVSQALVPQAEQMAMDCPILTIRRQLVPPWGKPEPLHPVE
jgi:hypothetical protein